MDLGKMILELRKEKGVTQEELAAELGVTAAAVSKWENGYTLPDVLMICALADFFGVTTDELLGREKNGKLAVIFAANQELGEKMETLAKAYDFESCGIFTDRAAALAAAERNPKVKFLIVGVYQEGFFDDSPLRKIVSSYATDDEILAGLKWAIENCIE